MYGRSMQHSKLKFEIKLFLKYILYDLYVSANDISEFCNYILIQ